MTDQQTKSIRQILDEAKQEIQNEPAETEATKQFQKDIDDMAKEYDGVSTIITKYQTTYTGFIDTKKPASRKLRDEVQAWSEQQKIPDNLQTAIRELHKGYSTKAQTIETTLQSAKTAFNDISSKLERAKAAEADTLAAFALSKSFENEANTWFTDLANLHKEAKAYLDANNHRLVFALFLEVEDVWLQIRGLDETVGSAVPRTPDWLLHKLNAQLRAVIDAKHERYLAHKEYLQKQKALATAQANYKYFVQDGNRRREFVREAQDVEPAQAQPSTSPSATAADPQLGSSQPSKPYSTSTPQVRPAEPEVASSLTC
jgi:hypothetical protein